MSKINEQTLPDFDHILQLIQEARNRVYSKANAELVMLYFNVGKIVSERVATGVWGENTVEELAKFIAERMPGLSGFNRRGLYRMRQFYETYTAPEFVSTLLTQTQYTENEPFKFVSSVMTQISWSHHLAILSKTKTPEEKIFYILLAIKDRLSFRELERQLNTAVYERTMLSNPIVSAMRTQLPAGLFKDPYIFEFLELPEAYSETDLEKKSERIDALASRVRAKLIFNKNKFASPTPMT